MLKKLGKKITNNLGLKILATLFAVALWIVVVNIDDPLKTKTYTTSVVPINEDYITDQGKYYEWLDGNNTVTFKVSAIRSIMAKLTSSDFTAIADMEKIECDEDGNYRVPVTITTSKYGSSDVTISSKQLYLEVALEDLGSCQKAITATTRGNVADGCAIGDVQIVGSNVLKISGPSSVVSQIDTVVAVINVEGMSSDVTDSVVPVLYDADGNVINTAKLKLSLSTVTISAQILNTKDVPVEFSTSGKVADGYVVTGIETSLDNVRIKGESGVLNTVNKITIPAEVLDVTDLTEDLQSTVDISSYLPSGTSLVLKTDAKIEAKVKVEPIVTKTFELPVTGLTVDGLRDGYSIQYNQDMLEIEVGGAESAMSDLTAKDITGAINLSGFGTGEHQVEVNLTLGMENCWINRTVRVPIVVLGEDPVEDVGTDESTQTQQPTGNGTTSTGTGTGTNQNSGTTDTAGTVNGDGNTATDSSEENEENGANQEEGTTQTP